MQARSQLIVSALLAMPAAGASSEDNKNRPVTKVINLLKDMSAQLEKEAELDQEVYDKMECWCTTNDKEKTASISAAAAHITDLENKIEALTAMGARLAAEIRTTEEEVAANQAALDQATAMREKQLAEFSAEETDLMESISALKAALAVLGKHNSNSFLQVSRAEEAREMKNVANTLKRELQSPLLKGVLTHSRRKIASAFIQGSDYFDAEPTFKQSYAPQSGQIFGILGSMKDTFEANLGASQKDEAENQKAYDELKKAKEEEIAAGQAQIDSKTQEKADTDEKNAQAKVDLEDTKATMSADEQFLAMLKSKCAATDAEWEARQKTRDEELAAVSKAISIISGDDAHDLFGKTFNAAFVQKEAAVASKHREDAAKLLQDAGRKTRNPRLVAMATQVRLDAFTKVKKAIDDMIADLLQEKADEIKHKDFCVDEFNTNQLQTEGKEREKKSLAAKMADLDQFIKDTTAALNTLHSEVNELSVQMKRAGENREKANKIFQETVQDQRATQSLLKAALEALEGFYGKQKAASAAMIQQHRQPVGPPPPPGFETYQKSSGSAGVMSLIQQIIDDAKNLEHEAITAEEDEQTAYEDFVKDTNASMNAKNADIMNKSEDKAKAEQNLVATTDAKTSVEGELSELSNYNAELHGSCDFVMKNFEVRQTARDEEVEALRQAKAILSGSSFQAFIAQA